MQLGGIKFSVSFKYQYHADYFFTVKQEVVSLSISGNMALPDVQQLRMSLAKLWKCWL